MRITVSEKDFIVTTLESFFAHTKIQIFLYGSRVDDQLRGGDIDLFVLVPDEKLLQEIRLKQHIVLATLKTGTPLGEQRIDLKFLHPSQLNEPFYEQIAKNAVKLNKI